MAIPGPFQFYFFLACAGALIVALIPAAAFVGRPTRGGKGSGSQRSLAWFLRVCLGYLAINSLEILSPTEASTFFFTSICYFFIASSPTWWFLFALEYSHRGVLAGRVRPVMWCVPFVAVLMIATNSYHRLNWREWIYFTTGPFTVVRALRYGPWFWMLWAYLQALVISGTVLVLAELFRNSRSFNRQTFIIAFGALIPIVVNGAFVLRLVPGLQKDFSPVAFSLACLVFTLGVYYNRLFDLIPVARRVLVEALSDPLIAMDEDGRIIDANPAARKVCSLPAKPLGTAVSENVFLAAATARLAETGGAAEASPDGERWYEIRSEEFPVGRRRLRLLAMRDVTERRRLMAEKTALVDKLSAALADIRTLEGIIPICASCKKIRDDKGYWQQVENYVSSHTRAEFSHGICPDCRRVLYPTLEIEAEE